MLGEADPAAIPEQIARGEPGFEEPEPVIPDALAARGFALTAVHDALPTADNRMLALEERFEREFPYSEDGEPRVPEHRLDEAQHLRDAIDRAVDEGGVEAVLWADAVCTALAGELRSLLQR